VAHLSERLPTPLAQLGGGGFNTRQVKISPPPLEKIV